MRNAYKILIGKPEEETPFGRSVSRWESYNRMYLREI
jgi:hypothetical protein